MAFLEGMGWG